MGMLRYIFLLELGLQNFRCMQGNTIERPQKKLRKHLTRQGLDPEDFDFVSFDWAEGLFLDNLFSKPTELSILYKCKEIDIRT